MFRDRLNKIGPKQYAKNYKTLMRKIKRSKLMERYIMFMDLKQYYQCKSSSKLTYKVNPISIKILAGFFCGAAASGSGGGGYISIFYCILTILQ